MEELLLRLLKESPESFIGLVHGYIEKYKPAVYEVGKEIVNVARDYANNTEICEIAATKKKNQFDAYVKAGFTEDQAIAFILSDNLQLVKNMEKLSSNSSAKVNAK